MLFEDVINHGAAPERCDAVDALARAAAAGAVSA